MRQIFISFLMFLMLGSVALATGTTGQIVLVRTTTTRDDTTLNPDWYHTGTADVAGKWRDRADWGGFAPGLPDAWHCQLQTSPLISTIPTTVVTPGKEYQVWVLYSHSLTLASGPANENGSWTLRKHNAIYANIQGDTKTLHDFYSSTNTGLLSRGEAPNYYVVFEGFLGTAIAGPTGIKVCIDTGRGSVTSWERAVYHGLAIKPVQSAANINPADGAVVNTVTELSWANPDPNNPATPIVATVYFGTEPNIVTMDQKVLAPDANSVALTTANFPKFTQLEERTYYWSVSWYDSGTGSQQDGGIWSFIVNNNLAPVVDAGKDVIAWLDNGSVTVLLGDEDSVTDDGLPAGNPLTIEWKRLSGPTTAVISTASSEIASVTFVERGEYTFQLSASDGDPLLTPVVDKVDVVIGNTACDASHLYYKDTPYHAYDYNKDCIVDLQDWAKIAEVWRDCTDTLTNCVK